MTLGALMTPLVIRMPVVSDATSWSATYDHHSDDHNIFYNTGHKTYCIHHWPVL
jgi:hypothetical protein